MGRILSHPFRLLPDGSAATVEQDTDEANAEQLAVLLLTRPGERDLAPGYGVSDPAFAGVDPSEVVAAVNAFGPDVTVTAVTSRPRDDATVDVLVEYANDDDES